jgi:hypothetical protein
MIINGGPDCLNVGSDGYVYADSCQAGDYNELFAFAANGAIQNLARHLNLTANSVGSDVVVAGGPPSGGNIWAEA